MRVKESYHPDGTNEPISLSNRLIEPVPGQIYRRRVIAMHGMPIARIQANSNELASREKWRADGFDALSFRRRYEHDVEVFSYSE